MPTGCPVTMGLLSGRLMMLVSVTWSVIQCACPPCMNDITTCNCATEGIETNYFCQRSAMGDLKDIFSCMGDQAHQLSLFQVLFPAGSLKANYTKGMQITNLRITSCGMSDIEGGALARSYHSLESLYMYMNEIIEIPKEVQQCRKLKALQLERNQIMFIHNIELQNLPELSQLVLSENSIVNLYPGTFGGLKKLKSLAVAKNELKEIKGDTFSGCNLLEYLNLAENMIKSIHLGAFNGLRNLQTLELHNNVLDWLPDGVFDGLNSLTSLRLDGNYIRLVTANMLQGLPSLEKLWMDNNEIENMASNTFGHCPSINTIVLKRNKFTQIRRHMFSNFAKLVTLDLTYNNIEELASEAFFNISSLESLTLPTTHLTKISPRTFSDMEKLRALKLSEGSIEIIYTAAFHNLPALEKLDIDLNKIRIVQPGFLSGSTLNASVSVNLAENLIPRLNGPFLNMDNLKSLTLSKNPISTINKDSFVNLSNIEEIHLDNCHIKTIESNSFVNLPRMKKISIEGGLLHMIQPKSFVNVVAEKVSMLSNSLMYITGGPFLDCKVQELVLSRNMISNLTYLDFTSGSAPEKLRLDRNEISEISVQTIAGLYNVKELYGDHQKSTNVVIDLDFPENAGVKTEKMDLSGNNIVGVIRSDTFRNMLRLSVVELKQNNISHVEKDAFRDLPNLQSINLQNNNIRLVEDGAFKNLPNFGMVYLQDNLLERLGLIFNNTPRLEYLSFENNQITEVGHKTFAGLEELRLLNLRGNRLHYLREGTINDGLFPAFHSLYLAGNPWGCRCSLRWLIQLYRKAYIEGVDLDDPICHSPEALRGKTFQVLARSSSNHLQLCPQSTTTTTTTTVTTSPSSSTSSKIPSTDSASAEPPRLPSQSTVQSFTDNFSGEIASHETQTSMAEVPSATAREPGVNSSKYPETVRERTIKEDFIKVEPPVKIAIPVRDSSTSGTCIVSSTNVLFMICPIIYIIVLR